MEQLLECPEDECNPSDSQNNDQKWMSSSKVRHAIHLYILILISFFKGEGSKLLFFFCLYFTGKIYFHLLS